MSDIFTHLLVFHICIFLEKNINYVDVLSITIMNKK